MYPLHRMDLIGVSGAGKTLLAKIVLEQLAAGHLPQYRLHRPPSEMLEKQSPAIPGEPEPTVRTEPIPQPFTEIGRRESWGIIGAGAAADPLLGHEVVLQPLAFEDLTRFALNVPEFAKQYKIGKPQGIVLAVVPALANKRFARLFFKSGIADLCEHYQTFPADPDFRIATGVASPIRAAAETWARAFFGIKAEQLHSLTPMLAGKLLELPADMELTYKLNRAKERVYTLSSKSKSKEYCADTLDVFDQVADFAQEQYARSLGIVNSLMWEPDMQVIVVATRLDIAADLGIDPRDAIARCCHGRVKPDDVVELDHVRVTPERNWQRVLLDQRAAFSVKATDDGSTGKLLEKISAQVRTCVEAAGSRVKSRTAAALAPSLIGPAQHIGWQTWTICPFVILLAVCGFVYFGGSPLRWLGGGLCLIATYAAITALMRTRAPQWSLTTLAGGAPRLCIGGKQIDLNEASLWQSPFGRLFDVATLRTVDGSHLIANAARFAATTDLQPSESNGRIAFEAVQVLLLAASALIVTYKFLV